MSELTKQQLTVENNSSFPNNNTGFITPTLLRTFNGNIIDSLVDEVTYNADSASWTSDITQLEQFSASLNANFVTPTQLSASSSTLQNNINTKLNTASFNAYTASQTVVSASFNSRINSVSGSGTDTGSLVTTSSFNSYTQSASTNTSASINAATQSLSASVAAINATQLSTASFNTYTASASTAVSGAINTATQSLSSSVAAINAQQLITASAVGDTITFTKGNGTTFPITVSVATGSLPAGVVSSSAQIAGLGYATTSSVSQSVQSLNSATASYITSAQTGSMNVASASRAISSSTALTSSVANTISASISTQNLNHFVTFADSSTGAQALFTDGGLKYNPNTNLLTTTASLAITASFALNGGGGGSINTGSFATTGSNTFKGTQTIDLSATSSTLAIGIIGNANEVITDMYVDGGNFDTFNVLVSASAGIQLRDFNGVATIPFLSVDTNGGDVRIPRNTNITGSLNVSASLGGDGGNIIRGGVTIVGDNNGNAISVKSGSVDITTPQGQGHFYTNLPITSSALRINGTTIIKDLIVSGTWGGSGSGSLFVENGITASVISASIYRGLPNGIVSSSGVISSSAQISGFGYATTGSNRFVGNQTITGSLTLSSSAAIELNVIGDIIVSGTLALTGSSPTHTFLSGGINYSGSIVSTATDTFPSAPQGNFIVTLSSASMATLLSGAGTNANTIYFVI